MFSLVPVGSKRASLMKAFRAARPQIGHLDWALFSGSLGPIAHFRKLILKINQI
jgi:hypothetical protein